MEDPLGLVGATIAEKYAIESVVGLGGFAVVYRARHLVWKRSVAVKVIRALENVDAERRNALLEDFVREGALLAELSEKTTAICQARDIGTLVTPSNQTVPYMVLEWLEGKPLDFVLHDERNMRPRTLAEMVRLLDPVAEALDLAHSRGITHRDVKPPNIFVLGHPRAENPSVKLLDFGIAKVVADVEKLGVTTTSGALSSFTPLYAAPEQFNRVNGATGPWTDVFALALVATEVLTGQRAMSGDTVVQLAVTASDPKRRPTPRAIGAQTSDHVERVFAKALAVSPNDRFPTAGAFWRELRREATGESQRALPAAGAAPTSVPVAPALVPDLDFAPRPSRSMAAVNPSRPSGTMQSASKSVPELSVPPPPPISSRMPAASVKSIPVSTSIVDSLDEFDMQIERGDMRSMPPMPSSPSKAPGMGGGMHASSIPSRSTSPIASTGLGLAATPSNRITDDDGEGSVSGGLRIASWLVALVVTGGTVAGMIQGAHMTKHVQATSALPHAFDGSSVAQSGAVAVGALVASVALGAMGVKGRPRSWALVLGAGAFMLIALAMVTVALGSTGEMTAPPDGVLLMPYLVPAATLGIAISLSGRAAWLFMHRSLARKAMSVPVAMVAGAVLWLTWAMAVR